MAITNLFSCISCCIDLLKLLLLSLNLAPGRHAAAKREDKWILLRAAMEEGRVPKPAEGAQGQIEAHLSPLAPQNGYPESHRQTSEHLHLKFETKQKGISILQKGTPYIHTTSNCAPQHHSSSACVKSHIYFSQMQGTSRGTNEQVLGTN